MNVLVLGAGAVGLAVAAKLSAVCRVHAVCRERHATALAERGFEMTGLWGDGVFRFPASDQVPPDFDPDYCLVTTKGPDTLALCRAMAPALRDRQVVSLQNGIGNEEIIAAFTDRVIGGTIITGFEGRGDAQVHVSVEAGPVKLGRFPEGLDGPVEALVDLFRRAGIAAEATAAVRGALWAKTLYNCALNPLGAIMGVPYGALADAALRPLMETVVAEAHAVATAEKAGLPWTVPADYMAHLLEVQLPATAGHHSSMLQDLRRGHPTEIDFMNGAVVERGRRHAIATPVNATLVGMIRFRETLGDDRTL